MNQNTGLSAIKVLCAAMLVAAGFGCATAEPPGPVSPPAPAYDSASGHWEGHWFVLEATVPAGGLKADVRKISEGVWSAEFDSEFGGEAVYELTLQGESGQGEDSGKVFFGGSVDLGVTSGGVFNWVGQADAETFNGTYTSNFINGRFELNRVEP